MTVASDDGGGRGYCRGRPGWLGTVRMEKPMLDDPEQTDRLLAALKAAVPFEAQISQEALQQLRGRDGGSVWTARQTVRAVSCLGDMGGIVCHLQRPEAQEVAVISLTHVRVPPSLPLAAQVVRYQKHRLKKLRRQGGA